MSLELNNQSADDSHTESSSKTEHDTNGGTVLAIAGDDFVVVASDTRICSNQTVSSREQSKIFQMTPFASVASTGSWCDTVSLIGLLRVRIQMYEQDHNKVMSTEALAQMISIVMYNRRFFPYYTHTLLAGIDQNGRGVVYTYDPVGHYERCRYRVMGTSYAMLLPTLDQALGWEHHTAIPLEDYPPVTKRRAAALAHNSLITASERDVYTGDFGIIQTITLQGVSSRTVQLSKD